MDNIKEIKKLSEKEKENINRREALKKLAMTSLSIVAGSAFFSTLSACNDNPLTPNTPDNNTYYYYSAGYYNTYYYYSGGYYNTYYYYYGSYYNTYYYYYN